ncbi:hypothetical protein O181_131652 [Austropuccinia psidii MF-1]|uniref:Integrase catalytic domain-containing protein n=1 Tax=Austropuccinia psidii MF-1 TaxID=1389203 RepID=A0A9Q3QDF7_9BASI|nr:hypothetical protein [Austropuccinia psidii MF-1]
MKNMERKRVNQIIEQYLWMYVNSHQDDWKIWCPLAKFDYNNTEHSSKKQSPSFTIHGRNSRVDSIHIFQDTPAGNVSTKLHSIQQVIKEESQSEIKCFTKYADRNRETSPDFQPGDRLWLALNGINTTRSTNKLSERWLWPFEALKEIESHAYHLKFCKVWI